jgi:predicted ATPase
MKIALTGCQNSGKTTFVADFIKNWPNYVTPEKSYREILKENNLPHSKESTEETQKVIMDFLAEQATQITKDEFVIVDRCVLDCLAYSAWLNLNGRLSDKLLDEQRILTRETLKLFDIVFFVPITKAATVEIEDDGFRETDNIYREEIDNIFKAFGQSYNQGDGRIFPKDDSPAWIEIFGNRQERIKMVELYLDKNGKPYGDDQSLLSEVIGATEQDLKKIERDMGKI